MQDRENKLLDASAAIMIRKDEIIEELEGEKKVLQDRISRQEEKIRDLRQLAANQDAEITALRKKLVGVSEVLDDLISSEIKSRDLLESCREVLVKMQAAVDAM